MLTGEANVYTLGDLGKHRVVTTKLPMTGNTRDALIATGSTTTRLLGTFQVNWILWFLRLWIFYAIRSKRLTNYLVLNPLPCRTQCTVGRSSPILPQKILALWVCYKRAFSFPDSQPTKSWIHFSRARLGPEIQTSSNPRAWAVRKKLGILHSEKTRSATYIHYFTFSGCRTRFYCWGSRGCASFYGLWQACSTWRCCIISPFKTWPKVN